MLTDAADTMSATNSQAAMPTPPRKRRSRLRLAIRLTLLVLLIAGGLLVANEMRTSHLQAYELSRYAKSLTYKVEPGPSPAIVSIGVPSCQSTWTVKTSCVAGSLISAVIVATESSVIVTP